MFRLRRLRSIATHITCTLVVATIVVAAPSGRATAETFRPTELNPCSGPDTLAGGWGTSYGTTSSLVEGALDNHFFKVDGVFLVTRTALDPARNSYTVRVRFDTPNGSSTQQDFVITTTPDPEQPCAPTNLVVEPESTSAEVSWTHVEAGAPVEKYIVRVDTGFKSCSTTGASCTLTGLVAGKTYTVTVYAQSKDKWAEATTTFTTKTAKSVIAEWVEDTRAAKKTAKLIAKKRYPLSKVMKVPSNPTRYAVTGVCRLSANRRYVIASRRGTCRMTIRSATRTVRKRLVFADANTRPLPTKQMVTSPSANVLTKIWKEVDAAVRFNGNGGSLEEFAERIAAIRRKWSSRGFDIETGYKNDTFYYYLLFGSTTYCLEEVQEAGNFRAYPTTCP